MYLNECDVAMLIRLPDESGKCSSNWYKPRLNLGFPPFKEGLSNLG